MNCFLSYCFIPGQQHLKKKQSSLQKLPCKGKKRDALITSQAMPADVGRDVAQDPRALAETSNGVCIWFVSQLWHGSALKLECVLWALLCNAQTYPYTKRLFRCNARIFFPGKSHYCLVT